MRPFDPPLIRRLSAALAAAALWIGVAAAPTATASPPFVPPPDDEPGTPEEEEEEADAAPVVIAPEPEPEPEPEPQPQPAAKSKLVWGRYDDVPGWKKGGLYASAGLAVVSFGAALGLFLSWRKPGGPVYKKMYDLAKATHDDSDPNNDVTYWDGDICQNAVGKSDAVVAQCDKGKTLAGATTGLLVAGGIFTVATVAFTTLMFVHREKPGLAKLRQRGFNLGAAPTLSGGFLVGGGLRF